MQRDAQQQDAQSRAEREHGKLEAYFDYRQQAASDRQAATAATLQPAAGVRPMTSERRIIPAWQANLSRDRAARPRAGVTSVHASSRCLEKLLHPVADWELVSVGRIEVLEDHQPSAASAGHCEWRRAHDQTAGCDAGTRRPL